MRSTTPRPYILEENGKDTIQINPITALSAGWSWNQGAKVIVLSCIPFNVNTGQLDIKLKEGGNVTVSNYELQGFRERWAFCQRSWSIIPTDTDVGHPQNSIPEKEKFFKNTVVVKIEVFTF